MSQSLDDRVAFITGVARGQGRSHAVMLAEQGVDIIGVDICQQMDTVNYRLATLADLDETKLLVDKTGRRMVAVQADVRDQAALGAAVRAGVGELGRLDIVIANAGIMAHGFGRDDDSIRSFTDSVAVMLTGVWNTLQVTVPHMIRQGDGGSIVITSSAAGLYSPMTDMRGGYDGYVASKAGVIGLMRAYAGELAQHRIRVNSVHPTGVATPMVINDFFPQYIAANPQFAGKLQNPLPVDVIDVEDVSRAVIYLVGESGRYVTGVQLPVDAGISA